MFTMPCRKGRAWRPVQRSRERTSGLLALSHSDGVEDPKFQSRQRAVCIEQRASQCGLRKMPQGAERSERQDGPHLSRYFCRLPEVSLVQENHCAPLQ